MYMSFYRMAAEPFGITPDPRFLFLSPAHREALAALVYGVSQRKGFISIIGEVGTGKTIILRSFLERVDPTKTTAIYLLNPLASFEQILDEILPPEFTGSTQDRFRTLQEWLIEEYRQGRNVVVVIDEAQRMAPSTLEKLRLLSNLETAEHKLIQVILAGQPELERKLEQPNLRQLWQRIAVRATIWPLNRQESVAYVNHRLSKVLAPGSQQIFTRFAINHLVRSAKGNPRRLNILCDGALVTGFSYQKRPVPWRVAWEASPGVMKSRRWGHALLQRSRVLAIVGITIAAGLLGFNLPHGAPLETGDVAQTTTRLHDQTSVEVDSHASVPQAEESTLSPALIRDKEIIAPQSAIFETSAEPDEASLASHDVARVARRTGELGHPDDKTRPATGLPDKPIILKADLVNASEKVVVNQGDGIWQLCREVYGTVDTQIVAFVMEANPHIQDPNELIVGDEIIFPPLALANKTVASAATSAYPES